MLRLGDAEEVERFQKRLVRRAPGNSTDCFPGVSGFVVLFFSSAQVKVSKKHAEDCRTLLKLMGVPYVDVSD